MNFTHSGPRSACYDKDSSRKLRPVHPPNGQNEASSRYLNQIEMEAVEYIRKADTELAQSAENTALVKEEVYARDVGRQCDHAQYQHSESELRRVQLLLAQEKSKSEFVESRLGRNHQSESEVQRELTQALEIAQKYRLEYGETVQMLQ